MNVLELETKKPESLLLLVVMETLLVVMDFVIDKLMDRKLESLVVMEIFAEIILLVNQEIHNQMKEFASLNSAQTI